MLRKFAAVMLATTLIAGTAYAAQPAANAGSTPAAVAAGSGVAKGTAVKDTAKQTAKPSKTVAHLRKHARKYFAHGKSGRVTQHVKAMKIHRGHFAHSTKPGKVTKNTKSAA
jgi:hypothetical protein